MKLEEKNYLRKKNQNQLVYRQTWLTRQTWDPCHESVITK